MYFLVIKFFPLRVGRSNYEQLSRNARQKVEQCYAEDVVAKKYMELYNEVRGER